MAVLQDSGRIALAAALASLPIHFAWGRGNPAWDANPDPEPTNATALVDEIARRTATAVGYVLPDPAGEIETVDGNYTASAVPTEWVHVRTQYNYGDAAGETIRELGLFLGTVTDPALPAGQRYFTPAEIVNPGLLYTLERIPFFVRNPTVRQVFEYVMPF